jgi:hypothetical protein
MSELNPGSQETVKEFNRTFAANDPETYFSFIDRN